MKKKIMVMVLFCLFLVGMTSCGGNSPDVVACKAMECLKNGDAEGYVELMAEPNLGRIEHVIKYLNYRHKGIREYKVAEFDKRDPNSDGDYWVMFNYTDGRGRKDTAHIFLMKDEHGNLKVGPGDGLSDWWQY